MLAPTSIIPIVSIDNFEVVGLTSNVASDTARHFSIEFDTQQWQEKCIHVLAIQNYPTLAPLWLWVETSPIPTTNSDTWPTPNPVSVWYWQAIGGGGGVTGGVIIPPFAPVNIVPVSPYIVVPVVFAPLGSAKPGYHATFLWTCHQRFARLVAQVPVAPTDLHELGLGTYYATGGIYAQFSGRS